METVRRFLRSFILPIWQMLFGAADTWWSWGLVTLCISGLLLAAAITQSSSFLAWAAIGYALCSALGVLANRRANGTTTAVKRRHD